MNNLSMKSFIVACVATISSIGLQINTAEAITENRVVEKGTIQELVKENITAIKEINNNIDNKADQPEAEKPALEAEKDEAPKNETTVVIEETTVQDTAEPVTEPEAVTPAEPEETPAQTEETPAVSIPAAEKDLFARLVEAEAKGESYEGKVAVATVVLNRVDSPEFPDTVSGVINEVVGDAYAFSPVQNGEINKPASEESIQAVEEALTREDRLNDCIYFYNPEIATDGWIRTREVVKTVGNHVFAK